MPGIVRCPDGRRSMIGKGGARVKRLEDDTDVAWCIIRNRPP